jgi:hypothetical protein
MLYIKVSPVSVVGVDDDDNDNNISKNEMDYLYSAKLCVVILG